MIVITSNSRPLLHVSLVQAAVLHHILKIPPPLTLPRLSDLSNIRHICHNPAEAGKTVAVHEYYLITGYCAEPAP